MRVRLQEKSGFCLATDTVKRKIQKPVTDLIFNRRIERNVKGEKHRQAYRGTDREE